MNRRELISTGLVGLTGATAGCTGRKVLIGPQPEEQESRPQPSQNNDNIGEGVIESGTVTSFASGEKKDMEFTVDYSEQIFEDFTLSLVAIPTAQLMGVTEVNLSEIEDYYEVYLIEYDGERLKDEREYRIERDNTHTFKQNSESLLELDTGTYTIGLLVDMESEDSPRLLDTTKYSFHVYETPEGVKKLHYNRTGRKLYEQSNSYVLELSHSIQYRTERDDLMPERILVTSEFEIPKNELEMVKYIHNTDSEVSLHWEEYHEPLWVSKYNESVEYMNRPIVKEIANRVEELKEKFDITDDETVLQMTLGIIRTCDYGQDWNTLEESRSVRYPSHYFMKGFGDCKEMGLLGNSILHHLGYDTTIYLYREENSKIFYHLSGAVDCELTEHTESLYEDGTYHTADSSGLDGGDGTDFYAFDPSFGRPYATGRTSEIRSFFTIPGK